MRYVACRITSLAYAAILIGSVFTGCGGDEGSTEQAPEFQSPISLSLAWIPVDHPSVTGYVLHYGRSSPNAAGSCNYEKALFVPNAEGTIINLYPATRYFIAVSAFNGVESPCSSEVSGLTSDHPAVTEHG